MKNRVLIMVVMLLCACARPVSRHETSADTLDSVVTRLRPKGKYTEYELQPEMTMYSLHIWSQFPAIASNEGRHFRQGAEFYRALCHILAVLSCFSLAE